MDKRVQSVSNVIDRALDAELTKEDSGNSELARVNTGDRDLYPTIVLWNARRFLLRLTLWGLAIGTAIAFLIPPRFTAVLSLMPPDQESGMGSAMLSAFLAKAGGSGGLASLAGDALGLKNSGDLFVGILRSRTVEEDLVRKFDLRKIYWDRHWEDACKDLAKHTDISQDRKSGIITIGVTDHSPNRAAAMAEEYGSELNRVVNQLSTSSAHREREFLEQRLKEVRSDLEDAEKQFSQFASKNTAIDIKEQGKAMVEAASVLQGELIAAESQLQGLRQIYTEGNPRVRATEAQVAELKDQLEKLGGGGSPGGVGVDETGSLYPSIRQLPLLGVSYADLFRRTKVDETVFEALTQQYELAKVEEAKDTPSVKILDAAKVPEKRSFPPRFSIIILAGCLAFAGGALLMVLRARWQDADEHDPRKMFAQSVYRSLSARMHWTLKGSSRLHRLTKQYSVFRTQHLDSVEHADKLQKQG